MNLRTFQQINQSTNFSTLINFFMDKNPSPNTFLSPLFYTPMLLYPTHLIPHRLREKCEPLFLNSPVTSIIVSGALHIFPGSYCYLRCKLKAFIMKGDMSHLPRGHSCKVKPQFQTRSLSPYLVLEVINIYL